jgi:arsenate reductase
MNHKPKVLFFSTGNATRSRMAAAFLRRKLGREIVEEASTAVSSSEASPMTQEMMQEVGVDISPVQAKDIKESFHEHFAFVVTMSDDSNERSPVWPFTKNIVHWNMPDPTNEDGSPERKRAMFRRVRDEIARRVDEFVLELTPRLKGTA